MDTKTIENQGENFSQKEQELIQQLIAPRKEQNSQMTYEALEGYEVPPRTQFSMLKKPAVTFKASKMEFNCSAVRLFDGVIQILPIVNPQKKRLAAVPCIEEESASVQWSRQKDGKTISKKISSFDFVDKIYNLMGWDKTCRYKVLGRLARSERGLILVFDLAEAIMFAPEPIEYIEKSTGEKKKRQVKYYPDEYKYKIGKSYNDYVEAHQQSLFEDLEDYSDTPPSDKNNNDANGGL